MISFVLYLIVPMHLPNYVYGREEIALLDKNFDSGHVRLCRVQCVIIIYIGQSQQTEVFLLGALNDYEDARGKLAENRRSE